MFKILTNLNVSKLLMYCYTGMSVLTWIFFAFSKGLVH